MCDADTEEALSYYDIEDADDFEAFVERSRDDVADAALDQGLPRREPSSTMIAKAGCSEDREPVLRYAIASWPC